MTYLQTILMMGAAIAVAAGCAGEVIGPGGDSESSSGSGAASSGSSSGAGAGSTGVGAGSTGSGPSGCSGLPAVCVNSSPNADLLQILQACEMSTGECCSCVDVKLVTDNNGCALSISSSSATLKLLDCVAQSASMVFWACLPDKPVFAVDNCTD